MQVAETLKKKWTFVILRLKNLVQVNRERESLRWPRASACEV